jgi:phenylacetate-CoA ligase
MKMVDIIGSLKANKVGMPFWLGQLFAFIPFSWRPMVGKQYRMKKKEMCAYDKMNGEERKQFIFDHMYRIVEYALNNIKFYQEFYAKKGFKLEDLKSFEDIEKIPVITKQDLLEYSIEDRTNMAVKKYKVNTGGSSGYTLSFYHSPDRIGTGWAHYHRMWGRLGFKPYKLRMTLGGRSNIKGGLWYEFARHAIALDMYKPYAETAPKLKKFLKRHKCYFLHGYPSVMADLATYCEKDDELRELFKKGLQGAFLNSEFPYPMYRDKVEQVFGIKTQSFYGHTESCVMAWEDDDEKFLYHPYQTYGYGEAVKNDDGRYDLIGTSYDNIASPLIRYNTKDIIDNPEYEDGILTSFYIYEGRSNQVVIDRNGMNISLTGLIMGRHHELMEKSSHIQVSQQEKGEATIYYVPLPGSAITDPSELFDSSNVAIDFEFKQIEAPLRTKAGKVLLLVPNSVVEDAFGDA